jgi:DNA-binding transcriptional LysR family regulator
VQLPVMVVRDELHQGGLNHLRPGWAPRSEMVHAVFPSRRGLLPSVRSLVDFLAARFREIDKE